MGEGENDLGLASRVLGGWPDDAPEWTCEEADAVRRALTIALVVVLPVGAVGVGLVASAWAYLYTRSRTGSTGTDRLRGWAAWYALRAWGVRAVTDLRLVRAVVGIIHQESDGRRSQYISDDDPVRFPGGPSRGPMSTYRQTHEELGIWRRPSGATDEQARDAYKRDAFDERRGIREGIAEFSHHLDRTHGDIPAALKRYNGSGEYRDRVVAFAGDRGWSLS